MGGTRALCAAATLAGSALLALQAHAETTTCRRSLSGLSVNCTTTGRDFDPPRPIIITPPVERSVPEIRYVPTPSPPPQLRLPTAADLSTGNGFLSACQGSLEDMMRKGTVDSCQGYVNGFMNRETLLPSASREVCFQDGMRTSQFKDVLIAYLQANPATRHIETSLLAIAALREALPCQKASAATAQKPWERRARQ